MTPAHHLPPFPSTHISSVPFPISLFHSLLLIFPPPSLSCHPLTLISNSHLVSAKNRLKNEFGEKLCAGEDPLRDSSATAVWRYHRPAPRNWGERQQGTRQSMRAFERACSCSFRIKTLYRWPGTCKARRIVPLVLSSVFHTARMPQH